MTTLSIMFGVSSNMTSWSDMHMRTYVINIFLICDWNETQVTWTTGYICKCKRLWGRSVPLNKWRERFIFLPSASFVSAARPRMCPFRPRHHRYPFQQVVFFPSLGWSHPSYHPALEIGPALQEARHGCSKKHVQAHSKSFSKLVIKLPEN